MGRLREETVQAGLTSLSAGNVVAGCVIAFVVVTVFALATTGVAPVAVCFGAIAGWAPLALVRARARRRRTHLRDLWPDAVDNIASGVRAGLALPEALAQLAVRGPEELRPAFASFAQDYRTTGRFQECLDALKDRLADPVGDRLVESLRIAREVGGSDLGRAAAHPVGLPARGRAHPGRARDPPGLDRQRRAARRGGPLDRPRHALAPAHVAAGVQPARRASSSSSSAPSSPCWPTA